MITDRKITEADYTDKDVVSAPDRMTGSAQQNKAVFDRAVKEVVQPKYNALIDELDTELQSRIVSDDILQMRLDENGVVEYSANGTDYVKMIGMHGGDTDGTPAIGAEIFNDPDNVASGNYSHAEGGDVNASGLFSHAEGNSTIASGKNSHAEGGSARAAGESSHAEGSSTKATGLNSHAEGYCAESSGDRAHAEGMHTTAAGNCSHAQGRETVASGNCSFAAGKNTIASSDYQSAIGKYNAEDATAAVILGNGTSISSRSNAMTLDWDGNLKLAGDVTFSGDRSLTDELSNLTAEDVGAAPAVHTHTADDISGLDPVATSGYVTAGRKSGTNLGTRATAEGIDTTASTDYAHAEGFRTEASGRAAHTEGFHTTASKDYSHAEGYYTKANGLSSHAEGDYTEASGYAAHAEGYVTEAIGESSHAEGLRTVANGDYSHAGGYHTIASAEAQFAIGKFNAEDSNAAVLVGNGTSTAARSNAMTLDWDGNLKLAGDITFSGDRSLTDELNNLVLPVAGDELGGVKNGGNVVVNSDGTMTAPDAGAKLNRTDFTETDTRWSALTGGRYTLTLSLEDQNPICVFRKDGNKYKLSVCDIEALDGTVSVISYDKFAGYLLTAEDGEGGSSSSGSAVRSINGVFPNGEGEVTLTASQVGAAAAGHTHSAATTSTAGFLSASDKVKLNGVAAGANNYTHPASHSYTMITGLGTAATKNVGTGASNVAAGNHSHAASAIGISSISGMQATTVQEALEENFQSVASGKQLLETAISDGGGTVSKAGDAATFQELAGGVDDIRTKIVNRKFTTFTIPDGMQVIYGGAFYRCVFLNTVVIPPSVTSIGISAFEFCLSLALTELPAGLTSISDHAFEGCTSLALTALPAELTSIGPYAFNGCTSLALTALPAGLTDIGGGAFYGCTSLALTALPAGLTDIGGSTFNGCTSLALTALPAGVTSISYSAFEGCTGLTSLRLGNALKSISTNAFTGCTNLTQITCDFAQGAVSGAPWGATNANITYLR